MRTTLDIDSQLLADIEDLTGENSKSKAVNKALEEYRQMKAIQNILAMAGKIEMRSWEEMEEEEMKATAEHGWWDRQA
jgi:hypothetical protein